MSFNIIHQHGAIKKATLADGTVVEKEDHIFVDELSALIACTSYQDHFIYTNPDTRKGTPSYLCTCGSVAVVTPPDGAGRFVCLFDLNNGLLGYHSTALYSGKDIIKVAGKTLSMDDIRKELI